MILLMVAPPKTEKPWVIAVSFVGAFMLAAMPLPQALTAGRPAWVAMMIIYWCLASPKRMGVGLSWLLGLFLDVLKGTLLGQHAAIFALIAYFTLKHQQRIRTFPLEKQIVFVGLLLSLQALLTLWIRGFRALPLEPLVYWLPVLSSMVWWPLVFHILRHLRRKVAGAGSSLTYREGF